MWDCRRKSYHLSPLPSNVKYYHIKHKAKRQRSASQCFFTMDEITSSHHELKASAHVRTLTPMSAMSSKNLVASFCSWSKKNIEGCRWEQRTGLARQFYGVTLSLRNSSVWNFDFRTKKTSLFTPDAPKFEVAKITSTFVVYMEIKKGHFFASKRGPLP